MMQSQLPHPIQHEYNRRRILVLLFLLLMGVCALPSVLLGWLLYWQQRRGRDPHEFWRGLIALAITGLAVYGVVCWLADLLRWFWMQAVSDISHMLWIPFLSLLLLIWMLNLLLAPACAVLFVVLVRTQECGQVKPGQELWEEHEVSPFQIQTGVSPLISLPSFAQVLVSPTLAFGQMSEVLGSYLGGDLDDEWVGGEELVLPPDFFDLHGLILGEPGVGKTWTLLRLAMAARRLGRKIIYLDMKGSNRTAALFLAAMRSLQVPRIKLYPVEAYDGWRGTSKALYNRLMEQIDPGTHPFYRAGVGSTLLSLAVSAPGGMPKTSYQLLERINYDWLKAAYATDGQAMREIESVVSHIAGLQLVIAGFFRGIGGGLDGTWAFEDVDACYLGVDSISLKEEAALFGRYLLEDAADYAASRKPQDEKILLIIDEFGGLKSTNATDLYEKIREAGMCIYAASQSYQSFGRERDHILAASHIKMLHRSGNPKEVVLYAGQRDKITYSRMVGGGRSKEELLHPLANRPSDQTAQDRTFLRSEKEFAVPIEEVQQLGIGQIALISGGQGGFVQVHPLRIDQQEIAAATLYLSSAPSFVPLTPPVYVAPPAPPQKKKTVTNPPVPIPGNPLIPQAAPTVPATKLGRKRSPKVPPPSPPPDPLINFFH